MASQTLGSLLSASLRTMRRSWRTLLIGLAAVSILTVLMQMVLLQRLVTVAEPVMQGLLGEDRYREVMTEIRLKRGSPEGLDALASTVATEAASRLASLPEGEQAAFLWRNGGDALRAVLPVFAIFLPLLFLVSAWAQAFFLTVPLLPPGRPPSEAVARATRTFLPLLAVSVLARILVFGPAALAIVLIGLLGMRMPAAWWPMLLLPLSLVPAVFLWPLLLPAPVLYLREGGILRSITGSIRRSKGSWGTLAGNMVAAFLLTRVVLWVAGGTLIGIATALASPQLSVAYVWLSKLLQFGGIAYLAAFQVALSLTVLANPRGKLVSVISKE